VSLFYTLLCPFSFFSGLQCAALNPDEGVWNHLKKHLANGRPDTQAELMDVLSEEIGRLATNPEILRGCIEHSELPLFLP
jgi:hypothetical protein